MEPQRGAQWWVFGRTWRTGKCWRRRTDKPKGRGDVTETGARTGAVWGVRNISFHNDELRVSERSSDSGQTVQRGPWEQKWLESRVFELTTRITKLMNGLRFRKSFMVIKWWYPTYSIMALPWSCRVRVSVVAELLSRNGLWRLEPFSLLAPEGEEKNLWAKKALIIERLSGRPWREENRVF